MVSNKTRTLVIVASGVLVMAGNMKANALTESFTVSAADDFTDFTKTLSLSQFNTSLGTLTSVSLTYGEDVLDSGSLSTGNKSLTYSFTGTSTLANSTLGISQTASVTETGTLGAGGSTSISDSKSNTGGPVTGPLAPFEGAGTINFTLTGTGTSDLSGGGNVSDSVATEAGGFVKVTYNYNPIPEASTLLGLGSMLGIGGLQLRRMMRKKA